MRQPLPDSLTRTNTFDGWKYTFPWRDVPPPLRAKLRGYLAIAAVAGVAGIVLALWADTSADLPSRVFLQCLAAAAGLAMAALVGLCALFTWTRSEVEITPTGVTLVERQGVMQQVRHRPWDRVARIVTHHLVHYPYQRYGDPPAVGTLEIVGKGAQTLWFAHDYPRDWLLALADELAWTGRVPHEEAPWGPEPAATCRAFFAHDCRDEDTFDRDVPPDGSAGTVAQTGGEWALTLPAAPFWHNAKGRVMLAVVAVLVTGALALGGVWAQRGAQGIGDLAPFAVFVGLGLLFAAAQLLKGVRGARLHLDHQTLTITEEFRLYPTRTHTTDRAEIVAVRLENSNVASRDIAVPHLHIVRANGKFVTALADRDQEELRWIATELRKALGVPAVAPRPVSM